jgi:hypothetical protein
MRLTAMCSSPVAVLAALLLCFAAAHAMGKQLLVPHIVDGGRRRLVAAMTDTWQTH